MKAKEYEKLQQSLTKADRDKFDLEDNPEYRQFLIDDALGSMKEKLLKYGTSRDPSEFTNPPEWSNPSEYKGFVIAICKYRDKYLGVAKELNTGSVDLEGDWHEDKNKAGQQIIKYINLFRKQAKMKRLDEIVDKRERIRERAEAMKGLTIIN